MELGEKKNLYSKYPFLTYRLRKDGGFWVCDDEIDLIPPRGSVVIVWSPLWQLIGGQFSIVTPTLPHHKGWRGGGMNNEWSLRKPLPGPGPWHMKGMWLVIGKQYA